MHLNGLQQVIPELIHLIPGRRDLLCILILLDQSQGLFSIRALAHQEKDFFRFARLQIDVKLQRGARIEARLHGARQSDAIERGRMTKISQAPQELGAIRRQAVKPLAGSHERDALAKFGVVAIARQERLMVAVIFGDDILLRGVARHTQHPFGIKRRGDPPRVRPRVLQAQLHHLDRRIRGGKEPQALGRVRDCCARKSNNRRRGESGTAPARDTAAGVGDQTSAVSSSRK